ncbi:MAG TPA: PH domain-containing protein [Verrucomicrobiae bacterium]|jgi:hypothetical protein
MLESAELVLNPRLDPGEHLLWIGKPRSGIRTRSQDVFLIPFSLMWGGFAIFWEFMAITGTQKMRHPSPFAPSIFGVPFVLIGLYLIVGRFFVDAKMRARTFYGVTNERVIIISGLFSQQVKSLQLRTISDVSLTEKSDGSGTITFGPTPFGNFFGSGSWPGGNRNAPPSFDMIEHAKEVYETIRRAQKSASANG